MKALAHTTTIEDAASEGRYLAMKLLPKRTGLPMTVWITEQGSARHALRIKVSLMRGGKGRWDDAVPVSLRPLKDITNALPDCGLPSGLPMDRAEPEYDHRLLERRNRRL